MFMDKEILSAIKKQTDIEDDLLIEKTYYEKRCDIGETILTLMNIPYKKKPMKARTVFDDVREICDDKDSYFLTQQ